MLPIISQPYRLSEAERVGAARSLSRGLRPLALNAFVLLSAFAAILWADFAMLDTVIAWLEARFGEVPPVVVGGTAALTFAVPWLVVYAFWRPVWFRLVRRRVAALTPGQENLVATIDETGIRVEESGLMVPLAAIGGRPVLPTLAARISPAAMAASDRSIRDAVA